MDDLLKKVEIEQQQIQPLIEYMKLHIQLLANILNLWPEFYIDVNDLLAIFYLACCILRNPIPANRPRAQVASCTLPPLTKLD